MFGFEAAFEESERLGSSLCVLEEHRKILCVAGDGRGGLIAAYDLARDPGEGSDLAGTDATWPRELLAEHAESIELLLTPLVDGESAVMTPEVAAELRALGY